MKFFKPIQWGFCSQRFGENKVPFYKQMNLDGHNGIDFACQKGTKIYWNGEGKGKVIKTIASPTQGFGVYIVTEDELGRFMYIYWHNLENKVKAGDIVEMGNLIALADSTGQYTTGHHLHWGKYEVDSNNWILNKDNGYGGAIDPIDNTYIDTFVLDIVEKKLEVLKKIRDALIKLIGLLKGRK